MKTLDEVIKANECCDHGEPDSRCEDCPYNGIGACCAERETDALHYLKTIETTENLYHDAVNELSKWIEEDWKDRCLPLTWDELRQMEGKPVWFEGYAGKFWCIIREVQRNMDGTQDIVLDGPSGMTGVGHDDLYGTRWQAYRKERG